LSTEYAGEKNLKVGEYLAKIWTKVCSLLYWATLYNDSDICVEVNDDDCNVYFCCRCSIKLQNQQAAAEFT